MKLAVSLLIVAAIAALAAPQARQLLIERRAVAVAQDLRTFVSAFEAYAHEHGNWPATTAAPGEIPAGMEQRLVGTSWRKSTPVGGGYRWVRKTPQRGERYQAAILIVPTAAGAVSDDRGQLGAIDARVDDGDLSAGKFRLGHRDLPFLIIEH